MFLEKHDSQFCKATIDVLLLSTQQSSKHEVYGVAPIEVIFVMSAGLKRVHFSKKANNIEKHNLLG